MDKDRLIGAAKQVLGAVKENIGKTVGDAKLQADGKADQIEGKVQNAVGSAKEALVEKLVSEAEHQAEAITATSLPVAIAPTGAVKP